MKKWLIILAFSGSLKAATIIAPDAELSTIQNIVDTQIINNDILQVPAGTAYWTARLLIPNGKAFWLRGAGTNNTIIIDENPSRTGGAAQGTLIRFAHRQIGVQMRISDFQFKRGVTNTAQAVNGVIFVSASNNLTDNSNWRLDHCYFNQVRGRAMYIEAWAGVVDNNLFAITSGQNGCVVDGRVVSGEYGDRVWANPVLVGTVDEGVFFENNLELYTPTTSNILPTNSDAFAGAKVVRRFCVSTNISEGGHGTESTKRARGQRWFANYGNRMWSAYGGEYATLMRSGGGVQFSNTVTGGFPGLLRMTNFREVTSFPPWNGAFGANVWDTNDVTIFESGTFTATGSGATLTDSTKAWIPNQWAHFSYQNLMATTNTKGGIISANTATTLTVMSKFDGTYYVNNIGDNYQIRSVIMGLDQPGMGSGILLSGGNDSTPPTPIGWPNETPDPICLWANIGITNTSGAGYYSIVNGRNYTNAVSSTYAILQYPHPWATNSPAPPLNPPSAPINLLAATVSSTAINLTWQNTATNADDVRIERSPTNTLSFSQINFVSAGVSNYNDGGLVPSTTYFYRVRASNGDGFSAYSNTNSATTSSPVVQLPLGLRVGVFRRSIFH